MRDFLAVHSVVLNLADVAVVVALVGFVLAELRSLHASDGPMRSSQSTMPRGGDPR